MLVFLFVIDLNDNIGLVIFQFLLLIEQLTADCFYLLPAGPWILPISDKMYPMAQIKSKVRIAEKR